MSKFRDIYSKDFFHPEFNSGERVTDSTGATTAKEMFYRILEGKIINPYYQSLQHYDLQEGQDDDSHIKEFENDDPDLVDFHNELTNVSKNVQAQQAELNKLKEQAYEQEVIKKYESTKKRDEKNITPSLPGNEGEPAGD